MKSTQLKQLPDEAVLRTEARIAGLVVIGLLLFIFESYLPRPIPWLKIGLANIVTIIALFWLGWRAAIIVSLFRILIGSFLIGSLFSPGFFLSLAGGIVSLVIMIIFYKLRIFGILVISIAGAIAHNLGQLLVAAMILFGNSIIWYITPYLTVTAVVTGLVIGLISHSFLNRLHQDFLSIEDASP
jgi:heptaprenyl diphosphate synthase